MTHRRDFLLLAASAAALVACGPKRLGRAEADALVTALRSRPLPRSLSARFHLKLGEGLGGGTTSGGLVTHMPNRFRLEILSPLGTPMVSVASDGSAIHAWNQQSGTFYQGDDAHAVLDELTGGAVGLADVLQLLTGGLPLADAPVLHTEARPDHVLVVLGAPGNLRLRAQVDNKRSLVQRVAIGRAGAEDSADIDELFVVVETPDHLRVDGGWYPETLVLTAPALGWSLTLEFHTWDELGQIPDVFSLSPPPGARIEDLEESLREAAEREAGSRG